MSDFYNKYPYTDFHELNLDWVIERVKKLTEDWAQTETAWETEQQAFQDLHDYVMNYFNNLDVQDEINHKLDIMAVDGTLDALLLPYFNQYKTEINGMVADQNTRLTAAEDNITLLDNRISSIAHLAEGSTTADAELIDIRTPAAGFNNDNNYTSAGDAVRGQAASLKSEVETSPLSFATFINVRKWKGTGTPSSTDTSSTGALKSYLRYTDFADSNGSASNSYGLMGKSNRVIYTADTAYAANATIDTGLCWFVNVTTPGIYSLILVEKSVGDWAPTHKQVRKDVVLTAGKHIIHFDGCYAVQNISANDEFWNAVITCGFSIANEELDFGVAMYDYMNRDQIEDIQTDLDSLRSEVKTSPLGNFAFNNILKWFGTTNYKETALDEYTSYIKYQNLPDPTGTAANNYGIIARTTETIYKADKNYNQNDIVDTGLCAVIYVTKSSYYDLALMQPNATSWAPSTKQLTKRPYLNAGKNIVNLNDCVANQALTAGDLFKSLRCSISGTMTASDKMEVGLLNNFLILDANPEYDIAFWGDSLTAGAGGGGTTFPTICANLLGKSFINCGVGGENASTIAARQGGNSWIMPAGSVNGTYNLSQMIDMYGQPVTPLRQGSGTNPTVIPIEVNGQTCSLTLTQLDASDPNAYYTVAGYTGTIPFSVPVRFNGANITSDITVIWAGTNGVGAQTVNQRISIIRSMLSRIKNEKYIVLGISIKTESEMAADDAAMLEAFGEHFFPTRRMLVDYGLATQGITPTATDTTDISVGRVPTSLRNDNTHLNANGYTALGKMLAAKIVGLGYADYA